MLPQENLTPILIRHWINDPARPEIFEDVPLPLMTSPTFTVSNLQGNDYSLGNSTWQAANVYMTLVNSLNYAKRYAVINRWAATSSLKINPRAGMMANAYYDRSSLKFFYFNSNGKMIYTCESPDVVSHELGHAILDTLRPDLWGAVYTEITAFHESFGDINAILHTLQYGQVWEWLLKETGGNLRQTNIVSMIAEQFGKAFGSTRGLRDAFNNLRYKKPEDLPLAEREPHIFSRIFTGAIYDFFVSIFEADHDANRMNAISRARDVVASYVFEAVKVAPACPRFFGAMAKALLGVDTKHGGTYKDILTKIFSDRGIFTGATNLMGQTAFNWENMAPQIRPEDGMYHGELASAISFKHSESIKISDKIGSLSNDNPLFNVIIDAPMDSYYGFNANGELMDSHSTDEDEVVSASIAALEYINVHRLADPTDNTPWEVLDGKLTRSHYNCGCFSNNNANIPGAPEYGKPWKPENNSGCCPGCKSTPQTPTPAPKLGCFVNVKTCNSASVRSCRQIRSRVC